MPFDFSSSSTLVTGAGTGIGAAVAFTLARYGASVAVVGLPSDPIEEVAAQIRAEGGTAIAVAADVSDFDQMGGAVERAASEFGRLTHAVNSAGVKATFAPMGEMPLSEWERVVGVNLRGVFYGLRTEIPAIVAAGGGSIVNIASVRGSRPLRDASAYTAAKFGVNGLTRSAALEYADKNLRVNAVSPGVIDTPMSAAEPERRAAITEGVPMGRMGRPGELANAVAFLLSDEASFVNGVDLIVDGGQMLQ